MLFMVIVRDFNSRNIEDFQKRSHAHDPEALNDAATGMIRNNVMIGVRFR